MNERRIHRLENQIKSRVAEVLQRELADPQLGFVTVSGVELDREIKLCKVYWSVLGSDKDRHRNQRALDRASGFVRRHIAQILHTRTVPTLRFVFDQSIEGAIRVNNLLADLRAERQQREALPGAETPDPREASDPAEGTTEA